MGVLKELKDISVKNKIKTSVNSYFYKLYNFFLLEEIKIQFGLISAYEGFISTINHRSHLETILREKRPKSLLITRFIVPLTNLGEIHRVLLFLPTKPTLS